MSHLDDRRDDLAIVATLADVFDKTAVDLQHIERETFEIGQRRITGTEVVDRHADIVIAQDLQLRQHDVVGVHQR